MRRSFALSAVVAVLFSVMTPGQVMKSAVPQAHAVVVSGVALKVEGAPALITVPMASPVHSAPKVAPVMVPCVYEDGSGGPLPCFWDGDSRGNGYGRSYWISTDEAIHYTN